MKSGGLESALAPGFPSAQKCQMSGAEPVSSDINYLICVLERHNTHKRLAFEKTAATSCWGSFPVVFLIIITCLNSNRFFL